MFQSSKVHAPTGHPAWGVVSGFALLHDDFLRAFSLRPDMQGVSLRRGPSCQAHLDSFAHPAALCFRILPFDPVSLILLHRAYRLTYSVLFV